MDRILALSLDLGTWALHHGIWTSTPQPIVHVRSYFFDTLVAADMPHSDW